MNTNVSTVRQRRTLGMQFQIFIYDIIKVYPGAGFVVVPPLPRHKGTRKPKVKSMTTPDCPEVSSDFQKQLEIESANFFIINGLKNAIGEKVKDYLSNL